MFSRIPVLRYVFPAFLAARLSSSGTYASSPEFDWIRSCQAPEHEHFGHELALGPAAKRAAVSDSGQARGLRLIYFLPNDRTFSPDVVDSMKARIPGIRTFFLFADAYGSTNAKFDVDGNGTVDFADFLKFVDAFGS